MGSHNEDIQLTGGVDWVEPHGEAGGDIVPGGKYAISVSIGGGGAYGVGTVAELEEFGRQVRVAITQIMAHAAGPLTHADFVYDAEDQMFLCPRCEGGVEPADYGNLAVTIQQIDAHIASHRPEHERE